jgi:hypothetical protein
LKTKRFLLLLEVSSVKIKFKKITSSSVFSTFSLFFLFLQKIKKWVSSIKFSVETATQQLLEAVLPLLLLQENLNILLHLLLLLPNPQVAVLAAVVAQALQLPLCSRWSEQWKLLIESKLFSKKRS